METWQLHLTATALSYMRGAGAARGTDAFDRVAAQGRIPHCIWRRGQAAMEAGGTGIARRSRQNVCCLQTVVQIQKQGRSVRLKSGAPKGALGCNCIWRREIVEAQFSLTNSACWFLCSLYFQILSATLFFDSDLRTYTVRFLGVDLVRLAAVRLLGDRFVLAL